MGYKKVMTKRGLKKRVKRLANSSDERFNVDTVWNQGVVIDLLIRIGLREVKGNLSDLVAKLVLQEPFNKIANAEVVILERVSSMSSQISPVVEALIPLILDYIKSTGAKGVSLRSIEDKFVADKLAGSFVNDNDVAVALERLRKFHQEVEFDPNAQLYFTVSSGYVSAPSLTPTKSQEEVRKEQLNWLLVCVATSQSPVLMHEVYQGFYAGFAADFESTSDPRLYGQVQQYLQELYKLMELDQTEGHYFFPSGDVLVVCSRDEFHRELQKHAAQPSVEESPVNQPSQSQDDLNYHEWVSVFISNNKPETLDAVYDAFAMKFPETVKPEDPRSMKALVLAAIRVLYKQMESAEESAVFFYTEDRDIYYCSKAEFLVWRVQKKAANQVRRQEERLKSYARMTEEELLAARMEYILSIMKKGEPQSIKGLVPQFANEFAIDISSGLQKASKQLRKVVSNLIYHWMQEGMTDGVFFIQEDDNLIPANKASYREWLKNTPGIAVGDGQLTKSPESVSPEVAEVVESTAVQIAEILEQQPEAIEAVLSKPAGARVVVMITLEGVRSLNIFDGEGELHNLNNKGYSVGVVSHYEGKELKMMDAQNIVFLNRSGDEVYSFAVDGKTLTFKRQKDVGLDALTLWYEVHDVEVVEFVQQEGLPFNLTTTAGKHYQMQILAAPAVYAGVKVLTTAGEKYNLHLPQPLVFVRIREIN